MDDAYAIASAKSEYRDGYNEGNVDKVLSVFAPAFFDMSAGQPYVAGADARAVLRARLQELFSHSTVRLEPLVIDVVVTGNDAYDFGWHRMWMKCNSEEYEGRVRYFERWKKQTDGSWKIVFLITGKEEEPALEPLSEVAAWRHICRELVTSSPSRSACADDP